MVGLLAATFILLAGPTARNDYEFAVVRGVVAIDTSKNSLGDLYPWWQDTSGPNEIVVSNACGFADVTYRSKTAAAYLLAPSVKPTESTRFRVLMGEWCQIEPFLFEWPTLLRYRHWGDVRYVVDSAAIFVDPGAGPYVVDRSFISNGGLTHFVLDPDGVGDIWKIRGARVYLRDIVAPAN